MKPMRDRRSNVLLWVFIASIVIRQSESGFLQKELPLKVVVTTPVDIVQAPAQVAVQLSGSQALTVGG